MRKPGGKKGGRQDAIEAAAAHRSQQSTGSSADAPAGVERDEDTAADQQLISNRNRRWALDVFVPAGHGPKVVEPVGYIPGNFVASADDRSTKKEVVDKTALIKESAWAVGITPGKNLFMQAFMLWMMGSSLSIWTLMFLGMSFWTPISGVLNVNGAFKRYENSKVNVVREKIIYVLLNLVGVAFAAYKANSMGLLASTFTSPAPRQALELSSGTIR